MSLQEGAGDPAAGESGGDTSQSTPELPSQPLVEHLIELKRRVLIAGAAWLAALVGCFIYAHELYGFLVQPLVDSLRDTRQQLQATSPPETLFANIKLSGYCGLMVAFPVVAAQFYLFLAPGLYKKERRILAPYLILSPLLFLAGAALVYYFVMPTALSFFEAYAEAQSDQAFEVVNLYKVSEYLSFTIQLIFAFGLAFQLPIALTLMARVGLLKVHTLQKGRKYAVVMMITAAAILTPPDIISQIALFFPLYLLYEVSIVACRAMERKHEEASHA